MHPIETEKSVCEPGGIRMGQKQCSVIVIQYNPIWEKVKTTLNSILAQQECEYEIIVADDGSKSPCFEQTEAYFAECGFKDYRIVANEKNGGTVKNVISGIREAKGKYVRVIAPGDMLYADHTLKHIVEFMEEHQAKEMFGKLAFYEPTEEGIKVVPLQRPFSLEPYKNKDVKTIKKQLFLNGDNISGASYTWEREYYLECLERIEGKVSFLEDCANAYTLLDGHEICFLDEFVTWYEHGTGISTSKQQKWNKILIQDWISFYQEAGERYPKDRMVKKAKRYYEMCQKGVFVNKVVKNILFFERFLYGKKVQGQQFEQEYKCVEQKHAEKYLGM